MIKKIFLLFTLFSGATHADSTPTYDSYTGLLSLPLVSTPLGSYAATLQIDVFSEQIAFTLKKAVIVEASSITGDTTYLPTYDFDTGLLRVPLVNATSGGTYAATFQFNQDADAFKINNLLAYTTPITTPSNLLGCFVSTSTNS